jgi:hypothetical protein
MNIRKYRENPNQHQDMKQSFQLDGKGESSRHDVVSSAQTLADRWLSHLGCLLYAGA